MATTLVFAAGGSSKVTLEVEEDLEEVGKRLRGAQQPFEQFKSKNEPVWVNTALVAYAAESRPGRIRSL